MLAKTAPKIQSVVVIGGGIAGTSIARLLSERGVKTTLLEKSGQLTSGATWHAAGLVTRFGGSSKIKKIHVRALELLTDLHNTTENGIGLHLPGSIRLIEKNHPGRLFEAKQNLAMARLFDDDEFPTRMIDVDEIQELHPLVNVDNIECGIWTPSDGDIDPTSLTNCVAALARGHGATIKFNQQVSSVEKNNSGSFHITTSAGETYDCDAVVNAAGLWSRGVTDMMDSNMSHPAFVIEHQYAITDTMPEIQQLDRRVPVLRDLHGSSYIRQEGQGMLIGPYEDVCVVRDDWKHGPPNTWGMELFPDDVDRIANNIMSGIDLVPALGEVGFKTVVNGPTIWTGDSMPRVGRSGTPGWYDFNSLTYGIAQSLPLAEYLCHIMLEGEQPADFDAWDSFDPLRYGAWANDAFTSEKITETYTHNNRVSYGSYENRSAGRNAVLDGHQYPLHSTLRQGHGAVFGNFGASGIEVPMFYQRDGDSNNGTDHAGGEAAQTHHHYTWSNIAKEEGEHVVRHCGISYASFSKIAVKGSRSRELLESMTTAVLPKKAVDDNNRPCKLTYGVTPKGRMCTEMTICKKSDEDWYCVGNRDRTHHDMTWLKERGRALGMMMSSGKTNADDEEKEEIQIQDLSNKICVVHLCGPNSPTVLSTVEPRAVEQLGFLKSKTIENFGNVDGLTVDVFRVSFSGLQGFELHVSSESSVQLWKSLVNSTVAQEQKLRPFGSVALNGLRVEQGFKIAADLTMAHYTEGGIDMFVAKKRDFVGKKDENGALFVPKKRAALFSVDADEGWEWSLPGDTPVCRKSDGAVVGFISSSAYGIQTQKTVALGYMTTKEGEDAIYTCAQAGEPLMVQCYGFEWDCTVLEAPPVEMMGRID